MFLLTTSLAKELRGNGNPNEDRQLWTRPTMKSAGGFENGGDGSALWSGGPFVGTTAGLQKFYFNYEGGERHIKDIRVDALRDRVVMTYTDNGETQITTTVTRPSSSPRLLTRDGLPGEGLAAAGPTVPSFPIASIPS